MTLFAAAVGWTTIRTADRLSSAPFVEYRIEQSTPPGPNGLVSVRIRNITATQRFGCFNLLVATPDLQRSDFFGPAEGYTQVLRGTVLAQTRLARVRGYEWDVQFTDISPGADIAANIPVKKPGTPKLLIRPCLTVASATSAEADRKAAREDEGEEAETSKPLPAPILVEQTIETWFVENEIRLLWAAMFVWLLALMALKLLSSWSHARSTEPRLAAVSGGKENGHDED
ncbi:MAG TPA: hypothetical protein VFY73_01790 [Ideonella sp.]|uniref:hypothetical protein n=1 Tax=Ideonella sp. TaxID=1929293 RepID=UPI002E348669|nr:hypothetical protein [Ideonella sp.]HEX5682741.1 hypothetical protein [Ideonella sp.]